MFYLQNNWNHTHEKTQKYEENLYVPENYDFEIRASHSFNHGRRIQVTSSLQNSAIYLRRNIIQE